MSASLILSSLATKSVRSSSKPPAAISATQPEPDTDVDRVGAGRPVGQQLLKQFREGHFCDGHHGPGCRGKFLAVFVKALGDDGPGRVEGSLL